MLKPNDLVDVIAPSGSFEASFLEEAQNYLEAKGLQVRIPKHILGEDLFSANTDAMRGAQLKAALLAPDSRFVWPVRGGYGITRILPVLKELPIPPLKKTLMGFSDVTALHLFLTQKWGWNTVHGASLMQTVEKRMTEESLKQTEALLFSGVSHLDYEITPLNVAARANSVTSGVLTGGNLKIVESGLATFWQVDAKDKILILEDVNEHAYRLDRILVHLEQAGIFQSIRALIFGDFTMENKPEEEEKIEKTLARFSALQRFPIFRLPGIGHGKANFPWIYGPAKINSHRLQQKMAF